ncbi:MAG TPA: ATP-binding protein [Gammaproteobacteria bacterium]
MSTVIPASVTPSPVSGDDTESVEALRLLCRLRGLVVTAQIAVIGLVHFGLDIRLPLLPLAVTIALLAAWNGIVLASLRRPRAVGPLEVFASLVVDVAAFTSVIYFTGGPTNPFVSLYLVPISLAAASLPPRPSWGIVAACGIGYSLLWLDHVPLPSVHDRFGGDFDLHLAGMWINFLVAAAVIVLFAGRMARLLRERDQQLAVMREEALRDQQIVELGTLAAGTAHELNTPLSTLAMLVEELEEQTSDPEQRERLRVMQEQIDVINGRLNGIARRVGAERSAGARQASLEEFVDGVIEEWRRMHPEVVVESHVDLEHPSLRIAAEATIEHAIRNVLENAAHASLANGRREVGIAVTNRGARLSIAVADAGAGLDPELRGELGLKIVSTKERGLGVGLMLSRAALQRFGGKLELKSRPAGGVEAAIELPLDELIADAR